MMLLSRTNAALTFALLCLTACLCQSATLQERFTANTRRVLYSSRKLEGEWGNCSTFKCLFVCLVSWPATFFALVRFAWIPHPCSHSSLRLLLLASKQSPSAQTFIHKVTQNLTDPNLTGLDVWHCTATVHTQAVRKPLVLVTRAWTLALKQVSS